MTSNQSSGETVLVEDLAPLTVKESSAAIEPLQEAPHRSHDPENNLKRSDPFQFGSRLLSEADNVYEFNAWDHVETDDTYKEYAELQYAKQREAPVSEFDKSTSLQFTFLVFPSLYDDTTFSHSSSEASAHE
jgi:tRNAThr (cytosine32-N3)-methyltransferase